MSSNNGAEFANEIKSYLNQKYKDNFTVKELYQEFDGQSGAYLRALCCSEAYSDEFLVYCYTDLSDINEYIEVDGTKYGITDAYSEVLLQNQILQQLGSYDASSVFVGCNIDFSARLPSSEEYSKGLAYCMSSSDLDAYIKIYIISEGSAGDQLREKAESLIAEYTPYTGYVYFATMTNFKVDDVSKVYAENQHDFGNYLTDSSFADSVEFTLFDRKTGLQDRKVVKE